MVLHNTKLVSILVIGLFLGVGVVPSMYGTLLERRSISSNLMGGIYQEGMEDERIRNIDCWNDGAVQVDTIWFNWGQESNAISLMDSTLNDQLITPEYDTDLERNNPSAYVKGSQFTIRVQFNSASIKRAMIKATGSFNGTSGCEVFFQQGHTTWVNMTIRNPIPDDVNVYNVSWDWWYRTSTQETWEQFDHTFHTIYVLNKQPIVDRVWKKLAEWTTNWCGGLHDDKLIADAILNGFVRDEVVLYGEQSRSNNINDVLQAGYATCGGMAKLFYYACATQGVETIWSFFRPKIVTRPKLHINPLNIRSYLPTVWSSVIMTSPGLGRTDFNNESLKCSNETWLLVNTTFPYPTYFGQGNEQDDVEEYTTRYYRWTDGHAINFLIYNDTVFLYDLSLGIGPIEGVFDFVPLPGCYFFNGSTVRTFRENYANNAIDYVQGYTQYIDESGDIKYNISHQFTVKTSIIPDDQIFFGFFFDNGVHVTRNHTNIADIMWTLYLLKFFIKYHIRLLLPFI